MDFVFVILHYNEKTLSDTMECIHSIQFNITNKDYHIVVVENGSGDGSFSFLKKEIDSDNAISLLKSDHNLGFAKGNNLGCDYAIKTFSPNFLIVINNDTMIFQPDFLDRIIDIFDEYKFHILGPYIKDRMGNPQNPIKSFPVSVPEIDQSVKKLEFKLSQLESSWLNYWIKYKLKRIPGKLLKKYAIGKFIKKRINKTDNIDELSLNIQNDIGLHGSALIFSREYYQIFDDVFYPKTFMFKEEDILFYRIKHHNLKSMYHPGIRIHHKEDSSTDTAFSGKYEKEKFILQHQIESFKIFKEYIINDK